MTSAEGSHTVSGSPEYDAAFQGEPGAYSEVAAQAFLGADARLLPRRSLEDVFSAVSAGRARLAVVPLENTIAGTVPGVYELLVSHDLWMLAETRVLIDHVLIGTPRMTFADVRRVLSHPVALGQCRAFLAQHPHMLPVAAFDTAGAVQIVLAEDDGISAAVAGRHAADVYGGHVLAEHLQDHDENWTRFALLRPRSEGSGEVMAGKMLLLFDLPHRPGALAGALRHAADAGVDLTKIESRPISTRPFEYRFIVELSAESPATLQRVISAMRTDTTSLRVMGGFTPQHSQGA